MTFEIDLSVPEGRLAFITREVITIDRDYEDGRESADIQYNIFLYNASDAQVLNFHEAMDSFIKSYKDEEGENSDGV